VVCLLVLLAACDGCGGSRVAGTTTGTDSGSGVAAAAEGVPLRYSVSCPLQYDVRSKQTTAMVTDKGDYGGSGFVHRSKVGIRAVGAELELKTTQYAMAFIDVEGTRSPWRKHNKPIRVEKLKNEGNRLVATETGLQWGSERRGGDLAWAFPALPASGEIGAKTTWALSASRPTVVIKEWRGPVAVARLEARWSEPLSREGKIAMPPGTHADVETKTVGTHRYEARYDITATGRLLQAKVLRKSRYEVSFDGEPQQHKMSMELVVKLVGACDGPTMTVQADDDPRSAALDLWGELNEAIRSKKEIPAIFAPDVVKAHGMKRIREVLTAFVATYGVDTIFPPMGTPKVRLEGDVARYEIGGLAKLPDAPTTNWQMHNKVEVAMKPKPAISKIVSVVDRKSETLLEISATRLFTAAK